LLERTGNLPAQLTSLVGRAEAIADLRRLLVAARLLTLTGPGGIGKTRLALAVGERVMPDYTDGVWLVELAALADPALVAPTVAAVLSIRETERPPLERLTDALRSRVLVVILDNCEHLVRSCAELADGLLRACAGLQILATSREPLGVGGEVIWRVPGLALPAPTGSALDASRHAEHIESVQLFVERARAASGFSLTEQNSVAVAAVCRGLEGIPLAIELAARRTRLLTPAEIASRLGDPFRVLVGGSHTAAERQRTLRATLDWSFGLLSETERTLFRRLSVFAGGCTLEAAAAVCADEAGQMHPDDILDVLGRLVDQSLVVAQPTQTGDSRYRLLEPLRQYARERLREQGEDANLRVRHRDWCVALAEAAWPALIGPDQRMWLRRLECEHDNLRAALECTLEDAFDAGPALRLAGALHRFWWRAGYLAEGRNWLSRTLELDARLGSRAGVAMQRARLHALTGAGILATTQVDYRDAVAFFTASLALARELDDIAAIADGSYWLGTAVFHLGDRQRSRQLNEKSLALWRQVGDPWGLWFPLGPAAQSAANRGEYPRATQLMEERLQLAQQAGNPSQIAYTYTSMAMLALEQGQHDRAAELLQSARRGLEQVEAGDHDVIARVLFDSGRVARARGALPEALQHYGESLSRFQKSGDVWGIGDGLYDIGVVLSDLGQFEPAARLMGAVAAVGEQRGIQLSSPIEARQLQERNAVRTALGVEHFDALTRAGRALAIEDAIAEALAVVRSQSVAHGPPGPHGDEPLTPRELEVATLISRGRSNREIADELVIAVSTAERHVANILAKLGLTSRTQVAAWFFRTGRPGTLR
jgi:non-specific serine/threonine protein kinase